MEYRSMWCPICKKDTEHVRPNAPGQSYNDKGTWTCTQCGTKAVPTS